jgi:hypothetical protein
MDIPGGVSGDGSEDAGSETERNCIPIPVDGSISIPTDECLCGYLSSKRSEAAPVRFMVTREDVDRAIARPSYLSMLLGVDALLPPYHAHPQTQCTSACSSASVEDTMVEYLLQEQPVCCHTDISKTKVAHDAPKSPTTRMHQATDTWSLTIEDPLDQYLYDVV